MRLFIALTMSLTAGAALAGGVMPQTDQPDILYIGDGWPPNLTNGCLDRGECRLPELPKTVRHAYPVGMPRNGGIPGMGAGSGCSGAVQGVGDIRQMYDIVSRCISGGGLRNGHHPLS